MPQFWRIYNNKVLPVSETELLGWPKDDAYNIPDEYLNKQEFLILRAAMGLGDWGIISAMPRILKEKYPDCKIYIPSKSLLKKLFGQLAELWNWPDAFNNANVIFKNNPYIDGVIDEFQGDIFHDHYRVFDPNIEEEPLLRQILRFWQFTDAEIDALVLRPELYWSDEEKELGDKIIELHCDGSEFGTLLLSDRYDYNRHDWNEKINGALDKDLPYFYWTSKPLRLTPFADIQPALDMRYIDPRIQLYIKSKAKLNVGIQCGVNDCMPRYAKTVSVVRGKLGSNIVPGEIYL